MHVCHVMYLARIILTFARVCAFVSGNMDCRIVLCVNTDTDNIYIYMHIHMQVCIDIQTPLSGTYNHKYTYRQAYTIDTLMFIRTLWARIRCYYVL